MAIAAIQVLSSYNFFLLAWLTMITVFRSRKKDLLFYISSISLGLSSLFFFLHVLYLEKLFQRFVPAMKILLVVFLVISLCLPFFWFLITKWFFDKDVKQNSVFFTLPLLCSVSVFYDLYTKDTFTFANITLGQISFFSRILLSSYLLAITFLALLPFRLKELTYSKDVRKTRTYQQFRLVSLALFTIACIVSYTIFTGEKKSIAFFVYADLTITTLITLVLLAFAKAVISFEALSQQSLPELSLHKEWLHVLVFIGIYSVSLWYLQQVSGERLYFLLVGLLFLFSQTLSYRRVAQEMRKTRRLLFSFLSFKGFSQDSLTEIQQIHIELEKLLATLCKEILNIERLVLYLPDSILPIGETILSFPPQQKLPAEVIQHCNSIRYKNQLTDDIYPLPKAIQAELNFFLNFTLQNQSKGFLFLGSKQNNRVFREEEFEISRIISQRVLEIFSSFSIAQQIVQLQKKTLLQDKQNDYEVRRLLHDELLPELHANIVAFSYNEQFSPVVSALMDMHKQISQLLYSLPSLQIQKESFVEDLEKMLHIECPSCEIYWHTEGEQQEYLQTISESRLEVFYFACREIVRNARKHAIPKTSPLRINVKLEFHPELCVTISDNGSEAASNSYGNKQGLKLHSTMLNLIGGSLQRIASAQGFSYRLHLHKDSTS